MENVNFFVQEAKNGKFFIYPTDTIYWIWAIWNKKNIKKIADIKNRKWNKIFSIVAPNFDWILKNYKTQINAINQYSDTLDILNWNKITRDVLQNQLEKYHGVTWIFDYNKPGVRILKHDIQTFMEIVWEAFITTSVNITWEDPITDLDKLAPEIVEKVDYIIDNWICDGKPSVLLDFVWDRIIKR